MKAGLWPHLTRLQLDVMRDNTLAEIIEARNPVGLQELHINRAGFGNASWSSIQRSPVHLLSFEALDLEGVLASQALWRTRCSARTLISSCSRSGSCLRIGRLTNLIELAVTDSGDLPANFEKESGLALKLENGLALLASLDPKLREVLMMDSGSISDVDLDWMVAHWPNIESAPVQILEAFRKSGRNRVPSS
ncbi:hypothetical protein BGZ83_009032 [Gryganskiella cystojenkinii]|nr:hypothetical protein BGZ83_009032 [Gryganskiella cystojenkinii]